MNRTVPITAIALALCVSMSSVNAATIKGKVADATGKAMEGVMVSAFDKERRQSTSVTSQRDGSFTIDGLRDVKYNVRARLMGQLDQWQKGVDSNASSLSFAMKPATGVDLEIQRTADSGFSMLKWNNSKDKENYKMMCTYCHQTGSRGWRTPEKPIDWETMIRRMDGFGGLYRHTQKTLIKRLVDTYNDDAVAKWPPFKPGPAPTGLATKARITEWDMGQQYKVMIHDLELGLDGRVYAVDMAQNAMVTLDPRTGKRGIHRFPRPYRGPHSIELGNDGDMWFTLCKSGEMAKFDMVTKKFTIAPGAEGGRRGSYPHTLRINPKDPEGLIWYTDAGRNSCFSMHPKTLKVKEYKLLSKNQAVGAGKGESRGITPYGIDFSPVDGTIWYTKLNGNRIGRIDPKYKNGNIKEWNPPFRGPRRLHVAQDGMVWVPGFGSGVFGKFNPNTEKWTVYPLPDADNQIPYALNIDPKGYIWICGTNSDSLHRFDPKTEKLVEFRLPSRVTYTREIEFDADGNLWTCNSNGPARHTERGYGSIIKLEILEDTQTTETGTKADIQDGAGVSGIVKFVGARPQRKPIQLKKDSQCAKLHKTAPMREDVIIGTQGQMANVFIYIKEGLKGKKFPPSNKPALLNQIACMFKPRVQGVRVGQELQIKNSDALLHNVRSHNQRNRAFNMGQPGGSAVRSKVFKYSEMGIKIQCDLHPWMTGYIHIMDHPFFAVTGQNGKFQIKGLPAGKYTLAAWHERYGEQEAEVTVGEGGISQANFTFKPNS